MNMCVAEAIRYLVDKGARVINISTFLRESLCPRESWRALEDAFAYADEKNVVIILAAGNNGYRCEDYPGNGDSMIVVGATLLDDTRWERVFDINGSKIKQGSNFGERLTVMAPAESIQVCLPHDKGVYVYEDGPTGPGRLIFTVCTRLFRRLRRRLRPQS